MVGGWFFHADIFPNIYMEMCQHGKTNMSIYKIFEYYEKLAQEIH